MEERRILLYDINENPIFLIEIIEEVRMQRNKRRAAKGKGALSHLERGKH